MNKELMSNFNQYGKRLFSSARQFADIHGRLAEKILDNQINLANAFVESSEKQLGLAEQTNSAAEFVAGQTELVEELKGKISDATANSVKIAQDANRELKSWFESNVKAADEAVKESKAAAASAAATQFVTAIPASRKVPAAKKPAVKKAEANPAAQPAARKAAAKAKATPAKATPAKSAPAKSAAEKPSAKPVTAEKAAAPAAAKKAPVAKKPKKPAAKAKPAAAKKPATRKQG